MTRELDDGLVAVLVYMSHGDWMTARAIKADWTQYSWLLLHGLICRRDTYRSGTAPRYEYRITRNGEALLAQRAGGGRAVSEEDAFDKLAEMIEDEFRWYPAGQPGYARADRTLPDRPDSMNLDYRLGVYDGLRIALHKLEVLRERIKV